MRIFPRAFASLSYWWRRCNHSEAIVAAVQLDEHQYPVAFVVDGRKYLGWALAWPEASFRSWAGEGKGQQFVWNFFFSFSRIEDWRIVALNTMGNLSSSKTQACSTWCQATLSVSPRWHLSMAGWLVRWCMRRIPYSIHNQVDLPKGCPLKSRVGTVWRVAGTMPLPCYQSSCLQFLGCRD